MSEQLLTAKQVAGRLSISVRQFRRMLTGLRAGGLQQVRLDRGCRFYYRAASLDRLIRVAAEQEKTLCA